MKRILTIWAVILMTASVLLPQQAWAQAPEKMSYQAVVRDANNTLVATQAVGMQISILQGSANGTSVYVETQTPISNANGLVSLEIGAGTIVSGTFATINWANGPYFIKTETDPTGGTNYTITGTSQLLSVPYALYAKFSGSSIPGPPGANGIGIDSTSQNANGTLTFYLSDGSSFTTADLTGPQGAIGLTGPIGPPGVDGVGIDSTSHNANGTLTLYYSDGSSFTTADLTGPQGAIGLTGPIGPPGVDGVGIDSTSQNTNGTFTLYYSDGSSFTTADLTGPQGSTGPQGPVGLLSSGTTAGNTPYWDGSQWVVNNSNIHNNGSGVGIGTATPNASAKVEIASTTQGFLPPRMTTVQRDAIASPATGLTIYNTTVNCLQWWNGTVWYDGCGNNNAPSPAQPQYPAGTVHCTSTPTAVVDVINPVTGKQWMDRNLGASQVATGSIDTAAYGDLYQWGRGADGHQCRNSPTTTTLSSTDQPGHGDFIIVNSGNYDWRSPQNTNLWQGVNGVNNPCPSGYRLPTAAELDAERLSWGSNNAAGAIASPLKLPMAGDRSYYDGSLIFGGVSGYYWSSTVSGTYSNGLKFLIGGANMNYNRRADGRSVRCLNALLPSGAVGGIDCNGATTTGTLEANTVASGVSSSVPYIGGNGGTHSGQTVNSTGVMGLTATLVAGLFANGNSTLNYVISGTPIASGTASFALSIGGQTCTLTLTVDTNAGTGTYPAGTVHCTGTPTAVVDVINPITGKTWMDRNLGASQVATSSTDTAAYGDLYQWGRGADGHQCRNSPTTSTVSSTDQPGHGDFIVAPVWRSPQNNNLWQGVKGVNNPCPSGYRLPTELELNAERQSWSLPGGPGAFGSPLKLPLAGNRSGSLFYVGSRGYYWSRTVVGGTLARYLYFSGSNDNMFSSLRAFGSSVRCLKD